MKAHKIQIPNPCSKDWGKMTPCGNGRHCISCNTVVRDFSKLSDTQLAYVIQNSNGPACGHFRRDQLDRAILVARERRSPDLLAVVLGMTLLLSTYPSFASPMDDLIPPVSLIEMLNDPQTKVIDGHEYIVIKFRLIHAETKEPLPFIAVALHDKDGNMMTGAESDIDGYLNFKLTPDQKAMANYLSVRSFEYEENIFHWDENWKPGPAQVLELREMEYMIDGYMIIEPIEEE